MEERNSQYELQPSRNGLTVPVINGVYLHSIYNPVKEAEAFAKTNERNIKLKKNILILGLGFGYHVEEIAKLARIFHKEYNIVVLEPNERLVDDFINTKNFVDENIHVLNNDNIKDLFNTEEFVNFLMTKPCIIKHDTSFVLEKEFYSKFLAYQAPTDVVHYKNLLSEGSKDLIKDRDERSLAAMFSGIQESGRLSGQEDYFLMAFNELTK